jgi:hypothetical protein
MHRDEIRSFESRAFAVLRPAADARMTLRTAIWSCRRMVRRVLHMFAVTAMLLALVLVTRAAIDAEYGSFCTGSKDQVARQMVRQVAVESYARWATDNPGKQCPDSGLELAVYSDDRELRDPWGTTLVVLCEETLPGGIRVVSAGPDAKPDTSDDIRSWDAERERKAPRSCSS